MSWEQLVERSVGGPVSRGSMFGSQGLRTGTKFFALWWQERLVVKPPPDRLQELVEAGDAEPFEPMPGRPMNGWVVVGDDADWVPLVDEARAFVESQQGPPDARPALAKGEREGSFFRAGGSSPPSG